MDLAAYRCLECIIISMCKREENFDRNLFCWRPRCNSIAVDERKNTVSPVAVLSLRNWWAPLQLGSGAQFF